MKCFLFDLDGTLTDPGIGITNSVMYALRKLGLPVPPREELYAFVGPPLTQSFVRLCGVREEDAPLAIAYYREYFGPKGILENEIYPGIPELLAEIREGGGKIILATAKPLAFAERIVEHFGIRHCFDHLAGNDMSEKYKKKSALIEDALAAAGIPPGNKKDCVMVGDRSHDIEGAREAGIAGIGVLYGYGSREELTDSGADFIAADVGELREIILRIMAGEKG